MKVHEIEGYIQSIFLIEYPDKLLLLDGGCRCDWEVVGDYIRSISRDPEELKLVVVTHMHPDHAGGANIYREKFGSAILSCSLEEQWYLGARGSVQHLIDLFLAYWVANRKQRPIKNLWYSKFLYPSFKMKDGDRLPFFEDWTILETPGHTDRDLTIYHPKTGTIYVADLILKVKKKFLAPFPVSYIHQYRDSLLRIADLKINKALLAHGGITRLKKTDILAALDTAENGPSKKDFLLSIAKGLSKKAKFSVS